MLRTISFNNIINDLEAAEQELQKPSTQFWVSQQPVDKQNAFKKQQSDLSIRIWQLRNARLSDVLQRLEDNANALRSGIENLKRELGELDKIVETIDAISRLVGVLIGILTPILG